MIVNNSYQDGAWLGSPSRDAVSTPSSGPSTPSGCGSLDMTAASTQRTAALETKDALFSSKKRNFRKFPNLSTGAGSGDGTQGGGVPGEGEMVGGSVFGFGSEVLSETGRNGSSLLNMVSTLHLKNDPSKMV